jgi:hypothetical protein
MATLLQEDVVKKGEVRSKGSRDGVSALCFRESKKQIVPYFKVSFPRTAINEICLGPTNRWRDTREALEWFLAQNEFDDDDICRIKIRKAAASYRCR